MLGEATIQPRPASPLRTLLLLGRVSNLPTVWSNCLAGWLLGGSGEIRRLLLVCLGTTLLYLGGMYWNDAFDADFDREYRQERPIPSGSIPAQAVWLWGAGWLALGFLVLAVCGTVTSVLGLSLICCIVIYDAIHKRFSLSPLLMAACRFFIYLIAASVGAGGISGLTIWSALVLALYVVGLSYLARQESLPGTLRYWPCLLLAAPIVLAVIVNTGEYRQRGWLLSLALMLWVIRSLRYAYWSVPRHVGRSVASLLAGIVLVDLLAVAGGEHVTPLIFIALFSAALLFQRFIPAT